jgi:aspartate racemase
VRRLIGIVGGLGPLASTRFLSSIYRQFRDVPEQQTPRIVLYSDPTFPDRTTHFLRGEEDEILAQAVRTTESLLTLGVDHLLFCCYTIHRIAPRLPAHVLERFVSLLDLAVDAGLESQGKVLLLCTNGTRKLRLFEGARKWSLLADRVSFPTDAEQPAVHQILYDLKKNCDPVEAFERLSRLLGGHQVDQWLLGCTELHLLSNVRAGDRRADFTPKLLDPLQRAADMIKDDSLYQATYSG